MTTSPFGAAPASGPDAATMGPFEAAALARSSSEPTAEPFGALPDDPAADAAGSAAAASPFGVPAPRPPAEPGVPEVLEPAGLRPRAERPERPSLRLPSRLGGGTGSGARRSPLLVIALGGGALVLGALAAVAALGSSDDADATSALVVPAATAEPGSSATPSAGTDLAGDGQPSADPGSGTAAVLGRDPFAALVAPAAGGAAGPTATDAPGSGVDTSGGAVDGTTGGTPGVVPGGTSGGTGTSSSGGGTTTVEVPGPTVTVTAPPPSASAPVALTTAQTCSAVSGPMAAVEQLLSASASSSSAPVDTGTALRTPVAALRAAVGATADAALASRLDVATSSAESLRSQLLGGVAVTSDQLDTQSSLDAAVRTACA